MSERAKSLERNVAISVAGLITAWGVKRAIEHLRDTPERRREAYQAVTQRIDRLLLIKQDEVYTTDGRLYLHLPAPEGLTTITKSTNETPPRYHIDVFMRSSRLGVPIHDNVMWETDGVTGTRKIFSGIPLEGPSLNPIDPYEFHRLDESEWTSHEANRIAAKLVS